MGSYDSNHPPKTHIIEVLFHTEDYALAPQNGAFALEKGVIAWTHIHFQIHQLAKSQSSECCQK